MSQPQSDELNLSRGTQADGSNAAKRGVVSGHDRLLSASDSAHSGLVSNESGDFARNPELANVEAVLFMAREPLSSRKIAKVAGLAERGQIRTLVRQLNAFYDAAGTAFRVEVVAGGFQLHTRPMFAPWLRRLQAPIEAKLSGPAIETLAVVAYRQPVLRAEIEAIRGVQCGDILRQLMERDLVRILGRSDDLGRPLQYGTTKRFLELFGLRDLEELPRAAELGGGVDKLNQPRDDARISTENNLGASRAHETSLNDSLSEDESVTMRTGSASVEEEMGEPSVLARLNSQSQRTAAKPLSAAKDEDKDTDEEDEDEEWDDDDDEDDEDEDEDDDFVDEDWEEVDDEDDSDEEDDDEDEDEDWEEDEEDDEDWDDDEDEDEEEEEWEEDDEK